MELTAKIEEQKIDYKSISSPPGGILLWILILLEVFTFGLSLAGLVYYRIQEPELFAQSTAMLNTYLGGLNTVVLLTSGFFMASAVHYFKKGNRSAGINFMLATIITGCAFIVIKWHEYGEKLEVGLGLEENMFFTFYWLLTGFHFIHVVVGLAILLIILLKVKNSNTTTKTEDIEAGAAFWHMCDLLWLLLFPALYLVF
ncbi:cytochrome c oxidase subunit 3 [Marivirga sp. S37H4]|uniref:Cytochrome c oxidase subunit 3 n=1 Tax=Marivirga aurantiaca TaxID=2802615 RepID=A0A935C5U4_9BACT|nr:cytochrome c oxidase subunit 3 [Marivirga aurantiaca]MBK6264009.1 cytochrome c oxidase subunit 3 [Marivirga aurantiaca]